MDDAKANSESWRPRPLLEFTPFFGDLRSAIIPTWILHFNLNLSKQVLQVEKAQFNIIDLEKVFSI